MSLPGCYGEPSADWRKSGRAAAYWEQNPKPEACSSENWSHHVASRTPARTIAPPSNRGANARKLSAATLKLVKRAGLTYVNTDVLTIRRQRHGRSFRYVAANKSVSAAEAKRLASLAVPPAYDDVLYAADPKAHIQAIGRDAAGRLQYRYHPDWQRVRETRKARRLAQLAEALPRIRRSIAQHLAGGEPTRAFTLSAIIELVARTPFVPAPNNMHGCAARAARRRC